MKTPLEEMRERAVAAFSSRLRNIRERIDALENKRSQARAACSGTTRGTSLGQIVDMNNPNVTHLDSLVTTGNVEIDNDTTPQCRLIRSEVATEERLIERSLSDVDRQAHMMGIYPGVIRELFAAHGLTVR